MIAKFQYFPNVNFENRYLSPEKFHHYLETHYPERITLIGKSVEGLPIYKFTIGNGKTQVLAWSQMHGNESTASLAMLDLLESFENNSMHKERILRDITLDFIFMLNPDGAKVWKRRNAMDIDINRDYIREASPEIKLLKKAASEKKYQYAFNLHDQRTVFSVDDDNPATLAFLAPSEDAERTVTENRRKSMAVISYIFDNLKNSLPNKISRFSDEFYPTSSGDNFMKSGIATILFEGGHFPEDYLRKETRKYYTLAMFHALSAIVLFEGETYGYENYFKIPENRESHCDILYQNVTFSENNGNVDIAIQYREILEGEEIKFVPYVIDIGDIHNKKAWKVIDCTGKKWKSEDKYPKIDQPANFTFVD